jgi:predicted enzyme related to lactoylglutathione lyase
MKVEQFVVNVNSERPEELIRFYEEVVGLETIPEMGPGMFRVGASPSVSFIVEGHSELRGTTKEPERVLLNFAVADLAAEQRRLEGRGVKFVREASEEAGVGVFATFVDPDGNYCQLVEFGVVG